MGRKSSKELIKQIIISIQDSPKSINEIAEDVTADWAAVKDSITYLEEAKLVKEFNIDRKKRCFVSTIPKTEKREDTYFGLSLTEEQNNLFETIYYKIKEEWIKTKGCLPGKVFLQKTFFKVNQLCKLNLPMGWYQYGALAVKVYDQNRDYIFNKNLITPMIEKCIQDIVSEYSDIKSTFQLKIKQYKEEKNTLYLLKENLFLIFTSDEFSNKNIEEIKNKLMLFEENIPEIEDKKARNLIYEFVGIVPKLIKSLDEKDLERSRVEISQTFTHLWGLIALFNYRNNLREKKFYPEEVLKQHFNIDILLKKIDVEESLDNLYELIPKKINQKDPLYNELLNAIKEIEDNKEGETTDDQDELLRKAGLN